jgi:hypothetical protein
MTLNTFPQVDPPLIMMHLMKGYKSSSPTNLKALSKMLKKNQEHEQVNEKEDLSTGEGSWGTIRKLVDWMSTLVLYS